MLLVAGQRFPEGNILQFTPHYRRKIEDFSNLLQPAAPFRIGSLPQERKKKNIFFRAIKSVIL